MVQNLGYDGPFNLAASICTAISEKLKEEEYWYVLMGN